MAKIIAQLFFPLLLIYDPLTDKGTAQFVILEPNFIFMI